jgi:hypothetical protein
MERLSPQNFYEGHFCGVFRTEHLPPKNFCENHFRDIFADLQIIPTIIFFARSAALCALKFGKSFINFRPMKFIIG